jgi:thiol-disulfide isomerase/thioredoxin
MDKNKRRRSIIAILIIVIIVTTSFSIFFAYQKFKPVPAYEFKTGVTHPEAIRDLMKHGTVVLLFTMNDCDPCVNMTRKMTDLQLQYRGTDVTFATFNYNDNATSNSILQHYGITFVPEIFVIRRDGAVVNFSTDYTNMNSVKSAIEDARKWK